MTFKSCWLRNGDISHNFFERGLGGESKRERGRGREQKRERKREGEGKRDPRKRKVIERICGFN